MSAEASVEPVLTLWQGSQGAVINGTYPLRRVLHGSEQSALFLTDGKLHNLADAAIKIIRLEGALADVQLRRWRAAAALSHPHLIRLLDSGHCQLGGHQCLFVVMEHPEQTLAQVLPHRALTADEVREMLLPALEALVFLHRRNLVHGRMKPASLLVVNDQLKLASDAIRPAGEPAAFGLASLYDPPEALDGRLLPAGDIWGLGVTLVEALARCLPWADEKSGVVSLPADFPAAFVDPVQRCLSHDPARRPTAADLLGQFKGAPAPQAVVAPAPAAVTRAAPRPQATRRQPRRPSLPRPAIVAAGSLVFLLLIWGGWRALHGSSTTQSSPTSTAAPAAATPAAAAPMTPAAPAGPNATTRPARASTRGPTTASRPVGHGPEHPAPASVDSSSSVVHAQIPAVARSAQRSIHGHVKVAVLVIVDRSGKVVDALVQDPGPSSYFAHLARDAARKWQFVPAEHEDSREWLVRFEFTRDSTTGHATPRS